MTSFATPVPIISADADPQAGVPVFDDFADTAMLEVQRSFPAVSPVVVADLVRAYRPFAFTPLQTAHACRQRLREALAF